MNKIVTLLTSILLIMSCTEPKQNMPINLNEIAENYVKLVLQVGLYNSDFVDAYYGPESLNPNENDKKAEFPSNEFLNATNTLLTQLNEIDEDAITAEQKVRVFMLEKQLIAVQTKIKMLAGKAFKFDQEAQLLYDVKPPTYTFAHFDELLADLSEQLPGEGTVAQRYAEFTKGFVIPKDKLDLVFTSAIAEARKRTLEHFSLPPNENFVLEYVNDKSWSGYNYYQGNAQSLIQINTDFPIFIDRAIDLACHEGYPGHHVFNALLEKNLVGKKGWLEFTVYPLFSPQSLIAEGSANFGIKVAFPGDSRVEYEKQVLFPLAGLDPSKANKYYAIQSLKSNLSYASNEAARQYLNGDINREEAALILEKYLFYSPQRALQRTRFFDQYRSYVINYNLGQDLVANYVTAKGGTAENTAKRWEIFEDLLSNPHTASTLLAE